MTQTPSQVSTMMSNNKPTTSFFRGESRPMLCSRVFHGSISLNRQLITPRRGGAPVLTCGGEPCAHSIAWGGTAVNGLPVGGQGKRILSHASERRHPERSTELTPKACRRTLAPATRCNYNAHANSSAFALSRRRALWCGYLLQWGKLVQAGDAELLQKVKGGTKDDGPACLVQAAQLLNQSPVD